MKYLVFVTNIHGHFMEYIHHIAVKLASSNDDELFIAVPDIIKEKRELFKWPDVPNIHWVYFDEKKVRTGKVFRDAFYSARELSSICKKNKPDQVILLLLFATMPFLPFMLPKGCKVSGIIYNIYLYRWQREKLIMKIQDVIKYFMISKMKVFNKVFILNDAASALKLNKIWKTDKFTYLVDPYVPLEKEKIFNCREKLGISPDKIVFLHIGSITRRKGVLYLFDIISKMPQEARDKSCFVFAGKIWGDVKDDFYSQYEKLNDNIQMIVFDEFCPYEFFGQLCYSSDYVVLPYMNTCSSSGIIAYASQFKTPVIVPDGGMVPKLVRKHRIGKTVKGNFVTTFIKELPYYFSKELKGSDIYLKEHTIEIFSNQILLY